MTRKEKQSPRQKVSLFDFQKSVWQCEKKTNIPMRPSPSRVPWPEALESLYAGAMTSYITLGQEPNGFRNLKEGII